MTTGHWKSLFASRADRPDLAAWNDASRLTDTERRLVAKSIQEFQLGEGTSGGSVWRRAMQSSLALDPDFVEALRLFISEEQRHSRDLGRFLDREEIPRLRRHWVYEAFRRVRRLAGLEMCLRVLVTAEIIAVPYYSALREATKSPLLRALCEQILADEGDHLCYQAFNLMQLRAMRRAARGGWESAFWRMFLWATMTVVWREHGRVLAAGGYRWGRFRRECERLLAAVEHPRLRGFELPAETRELLA